MQELRQQILQKIATRRQDIQDIEEACGLREECSFEDSTNIEFYEGMITAYSDTLLLLDECIARSKKAVQELKDYYLADVDVSTNEIDAEYYIGQVEAVEEVALCLGIFREEENEGNYIAGVNGKQDEDTNTGS